MTYKEAIIKKINEKKEEFFQVNHTLKIIEDNPDVIHVMNSVNKSLNKLINIDLKDQFSNRKLCIQESLEDLEATLLLVEKNPQVVSMLEMLKRNIGL